MASSYAVNQRNAQSLAEIEAGMDRWQRDAFRIQRRNALATMQGSLLDGNVAAKAVTRGRMRRDASGTYIMTGYFTLLKYMWGSSPEALDRSLGFGLNAESGEDARLARTGADILILREALTVDDFDLRGYSHLPDGLSRSDLKPGEQFNPAYPPAAGVPQWRLFAPKKASYICTVGPGEKIHIRSFNPQER
jgi:hypothetical protein